jgi:dephospho-CoA kinase
LTRRVLRVGLTGGIASGKTTVGRIFAEHGALVVDADRLAHEAIARGGPAYERVVERFGGEILDAEGEIRRPQLARRVFADPAERAALDAIVHPEVRSAFDRRVSEWAATGRGTVAMLDAALLVETGAYRDFARLVVVGCRPEVQLGRLVARGLSLDEAQQRIEAQAPLGEKLAVADYVIDTDGTLRETRRQAEEVWARLVAEHAALE